MQKKPKQVQKDPWTFQDWWDREGHVFGVECFKACRAAWNATKGIKNAS